MNPTLSFMVAARPAGQGSKRALGPGRMVEQSKYVKPFRAAVRARALERATLDGWEPATGPVNIELHFTIAEPKKPKYGYPPRPDLDKMERAVCDALKGVAYVDDSQIVGSLTTKAYGPEGVMVKVVVI